MTAQVPYEAFEHTADIGLHAYGSTLAELFIHAALGMESLMVAPDQVRPLVSREINARGHDLVSLLVDWLDKLIFLFDTEFLLVCACEIQAISETELTARVFGEPYDPQRHELSSAIKAVTWHEASVERTAEGYRASIIFDI